MIAAILKEIAPGEHRVSVIPQTVGKMVKEGLEVLVEAGAGHGAMISDSEYENVGAKIVSDPISLLENADLVIKIQRPLFNDKIEKSEVDLLKEGSVLICLLQAMNFPDVAKKLADKKISAFSMDMVPRITRAQRMDVLSSMSSIAGYKAVLLAATAFGKMVPMMTTAAGTLPPAKTFILGAGVAGLQAIATAKRLGAVVEAFDTRPAVKEQVQSLGGKFVELDLGDEATETAGGYAKELSPEHHEKEKEMIHQHVKGADIVITTALIPGKKAPLLITAEMVRDMKSGSVIVDMAVEQGGNCELSKAGEDVVESGVTIIGATNIPGSVPIHASQMYSKNMANFLFHFYKDRTFNFDMSDEIIKGALVCHNGEIVNSVIKEMSGKGGA